MRKFACIVSVFTLLLVTGCATLTGKAKPKSMDLTYGIGYEDRDTIDERTSANIGPIITFDNDHKIAMTYRYRDDDELGSNEHGFFVQYTMPIWQSTEGGKWGEGNWINPISK